MKVLLDINETKASSFLEFLRNFSFVQVEVLSSSETSFLEEMKEAIEEIQLIKQGKREGHNAEDFLKEL